MNSFKCLVNKNRISILSSQIKHHHMINLKISIGFSFVLNTTGQKWHTFQEVLQEAIDETAIHLLSKGEMKVIVQKRLHPLKDENMMDCWYEMYARLKDNTIDIAVITVDAPPF